MVMIITVLYMSFLKLCYCYNHAAWFEWIYYLR
jgi:hypothetical protein